MNVNDSREAAKPRRDQKNARATSAFEPSCLRVPKLRFPEFRNMEVWAEAKLGQLCEIQTGKKDANEGAENGMYPFFTCAENHIYSNTYSFDTEAILVAGNANVGQTKYYKGKFEAYQRTYVLTNFSDVYVAYLYAILSANLRASLLEQVQTSAMSYIRLPMLEEYKLALPPSLAEQQKIADCLSTLEERIGAESRKLDALKAHKKGLMQQLFPREGETIPALRFPEFQNAPEWKHEPVSKIAIVLQGYGFPENYQGNKQGELPFYKVSDISRTFDAGIRYIDKAANYIDRKTLKELRAKTIPVGTIIFAKIGEALRLNKRTITTKPSVIDNNTAGVKAIEGKTTDQFLYYLWSMVSLDDHAGGVVPAVNKSAIEAIPVSYPADGGNNLAEQRRIADCLSSLDDLITAQSDKLETIKNHKRGLMQQLFPFPAETEI